MVRCAIILMAFFTMSFSGLSLKKRISDENFRYEFYTTTKSVSPREGRSYYWFKGGKIHSSEQGVAGELLHDRFSKFYHSNQLAETGTYKNGLKQGYWKAWYETGTLKTVTYWNKGQKDGKYEAYNETGGMVEKGSFKNNKKHGRWLNYSTHDTLKYKDDVVVITKLKPADSLTKNETKKGFFKNIFKKKVKTNSNDTGKDKNKTQAKKEKRLKEKMPEEKTNKKGELKKNTPENKGDNPGFFKRLFSRKDK